MSQHLTARIASLAAAVTVTFSLFFGVTGLAHASATDAAAPVVLAACAAPRA